MEEQCSRVTGKIGKMDPQVPPCNRGCTKATLSKGAANEQETVAGAGV